MSTNLHRFQAQLAPVDTIAPRTLKIGTKTRPVASPKLDKAGRHNHRNQNYCQPFPSRLSRRTF